LGEPDEAEVERAMRQIVNLPANRDPLHLHRQYRRNAAEKRQAEVAMSKGCARMARFTGGRHGRAWAR
jgi:hypothetical protein